MTDAEIASLALTALGANAIASLGASSVEAGIASRFFLPTVDALLSTHPWTFALVVEELVEDEPDEGEFIVEGFEHAYDVPDGMLRLVEVKKAHLAVEWRIKGQYIVSQHPPDLFATFVKRPAIADLPPYFIEALWPSLAARMAIAVTDRPDLLRAWREETEIQLRLAKNVDAQQRTTSRLPMGVRMRHRRLGG